LQNKTLTGSNTRRKTVLLREIEVSDRLQGGLLCCLV